MRKILIASLMLICVAGAALADVNGAAVTSKGKGAVYLDYQPWFVMQQHGIASIPPQITSVTRLGALYGFIDNQEIGILRIDDTMQYFPEAKGTDYKNSYDRSLSDPGYGLTYAYELSRVIKVPFDLRFQFEYDLPRTFVYQPRAVKLEDSYTWTSAAMYFGLGATKQVLLPGFVVGGSFGVMNIWNTNMNMDLDLADVGVNQIGTSAFMISAGVDYTIPGTTITLYSTVGHMDNSNLVGKEDSTGAKARDNKQDYVTYGVRYDM